jgi:DNA-binding IclR family transcriptional regulator
MTNIDRGPEVDRLQSVQRALGVLEALAVRPSGATPKQLSQALDLHLSTCYRLLNTLVSAGYATRLPGSGLFRLGPRVAYLNHHFVAATRPPAAVVSFVHALQLATGETTMFAELDGDDIVATEIVLGSRPAALPGYVGFSAPAHLTVSGRSLLAWLTPAQIEGYIDRQANSSASPFPLTSPGRLRTELNQIRHAGYAVDRCEGHPDVGRIAAPVLNQDHVVGSVCIVAPCARFRKEEANLITVILAGARAMSDLLTESSQPTGPANSELPEPEAATQAAIEAVLAMVTESMSRVG